MGNQQAKVTDICWLAGFIDGEGCFDFEKNKVKQYTFYRPRLRITNTHYQTLNILTDIFDSLSARYWVSHRIPKRRTDKKSWSLAICGLKRLERFLPIVEPYLKTKHDECVLMQSWIQLRYKHHVSNQHKKYEDYSEQELSLIDELKKLKHGD